MEKQGLVSDRCELNRHIRADNRYLRRLKATVAKLTEAVKQTVPAIADALETIRANMIVLRYAAIQFRDWRYARERYAQKAKANYSAYQTLRKTIREKLSKRKQLEKDRDALSVVSVFKRKDLTTEIEGLSEEIEELRSEEKRIIHGAGKKDAAGMEAIKMKIADSEATARKYGESERKYNRELDAEEGKFMESIAQAGEIDPRELVAARMAIRPEKEQTAITTLQYAVGEVYDHEIQGIREDVDHMLDEDFLELRYWAEKRYAQRDQQQAKKTRAQEWER